MKKNAFYGVLSLLIVFSLLSIHIYHAKASAGNFFQDQNPSKNFCISEMPVMSNFPIVNLVLRAYDQNLRPLKDISEVGLRISENGSLAVPLTEKMQVNTSGLGVDIYFVTDRGNRTDQGSVKSLLSTFLNYDDPKDQIFIYTDEGNLASTYLIPGTGVTFDRAVNDYPITRTGNYYTVNGAVNRAITNINASLNDCQKAKFLFLVMGDDAIQSPEDLADFVLNAKTTGTLLVFFHVPTADGNVRNATSYRGYIEENGGIYIDVTQDGTNAFTNVFSTYRQSYSLTYQSTSSASGVHNIGIVYDGMDAPTGGSNFYQIDLLPPQVNLIIPSTTIQRTAVEVVEKGYKYDKTSDVASVQVAFPDEYNRKISSIVLIIKQAGQPELRIPVEINSFAGNTYQVTWSLGDFGNGNRTDLNIGVEVVDELGMSAKSTVDVPVIVLSHVPLNLLAQRYLIYLLIGVVSILLFVMILMRRKMTQLMSGVGARVTAVVEGVRKTLVGGGVRRGKPLATLTVNDGPPNMIGQELKIYTEIIKLGRDPQRADMTFYSPDAKSSISGLHARIERVDGFWRIVAVSQSGSETFIDDVAIPFNEPRSLINGQSIRMGYLAQQPVVFTFTSLISDEALKKPVTDIRGTDVSPDRLVVQKTREIKPQSQGQDDNFFDEFRK